jgi:hypothetical protein
MIIKPQLKFPLNMSRPLQVSSKSIPAYILADELAHRTSLLPEYTHRGVLSLMNLLTEGINPLMRSLTDEVVQSLLTLEYNLLNSSI